MILCRFILSFFLISAAHAGLPMDIVFDIDQTIVALVHDGPRGDLLADPKNPTAGTLPISYQIEGVAVNERYRVYDGLIELMTDLKRRQAAGEIRVSFFSGGFDGRNRALLSAIKLPDGTSLLDLVSSNGQVRSYSRDQMTATGVGEDARIRQRFKKDLRVINPDLSDVVLVDDIRTFVPDDQVGHVIHLGEDFPYPERVAADQPLNMNETLMRRERSKMQWLAEYLNLAIEERIESGKPLSKVMQRLTNNGQTTPFSDKQMRFFARGRERLTRVATPCQSNSMREVVNRLFQAAP